LRAFLFPFEYVIFQQASYVPFDLVSFAGTILLNIVYPLFSCTKKIDMPKRMEAAMSKNRQVSRSKWMGNIGLKSTAMMPRVHAQNIFFDSTAMKPEYAAAPQTTHRSI